jgi:hypothetical protein
MVLGLEKEVEQRVSTIRVTHNRMAFKAEYKQDNKERKE